MCTTREKTAGDMKEQEKWIECCFFSPTLWKRGRWDLKASFPKALARWFITALCQKSFPQHESNNDTVIARTGELLIERYQLYVQLPRERRPNARGRLGGGGGGGGGKEGRREGGWGERLTDENQKNLNPSTWVSREPFRELCVTTASRYELTKII